MLAIMAVVLLTVTIPYWFGVPIYIIGGIVSNFTTNYVLIHISIALSGGLLFPLYFVPINVEVAKNIANIKQQSTIKTFIWIQFTWILVYSVLFEIIILCIAML